MHPAKQSDSNNNNKKTILGINLSHDTACAAIVGGEVKVAIAEERLNRVKYCNGLSPFGRIIPFRAIKYCCDELGIKPYDVDLFVVNSCRPSAIEHLRAQLLGIREERILDVPHPGHHLAHAYSTFYCSPFDEAAVIVVDTNGSFIERAHHRTDALSHHMQIERKEHYTTFHGTADGGLRTITADYVRPGSVSLGELYCIYSAALQLTPTDGHYGYDDPLTAGGKLMGLASYDQGKTRAPEICTLDEDGSGDGHLAIPLSRVIDHFEELGFVVERQAGLDDIFGFEMRPFVEFERRGEKSLQQERYVSLAGEAQRELERALILIARQVHTQTKSDNLCVAGGTMLNVTACTRLLEETPFKRIFVQPAANDAGIAIGAGLWAYWNRVGGRERPYLSKKYDTCLGRIYPNEEVEQAIERAIAASGGKLTAKRLTSFDAKVSELLPRIYDDKIIAVFEGRSEFGPRALGHRSFLASPKNASMKDKMNELKHREWYRPVAPVVLAEDFSVYFDAPFDAVPFMTLSARCQPITSERAPAVRHVDGSARPQTITADGSPLIHHLLTRMKAEAKELPILINTSLNVDKEPIVETPDHAVEVIVQADLLDAILIEDWLLEKRR